MNTLEDIYRPSLALLTDLYQLTMAFGYWKLGRADEPAAFHLSFREPAFQSGYTLAAGLGQAVEYLERLHFDERDRAYLGSLRSEDGQPLFEQAFLDYLGGLRFACDVDALAEGSVCFAHEPIVAVRGPLLQCQLLETPLLNLINFQTLVATKAARVCMAAAGDPVIEFGLRRAQGIDGGLSASRASFIGGCAATSNLLAGEAYGIPVRGTHAHSWIMSHVSERDAFAQYAQVMPHNCILLVDTYDTLRGVRHAAQVGQQMKQRGQRLAGIRLDSGDLAYLSIEARKILDAHGLADVKILASGDLDEHVIESLKLQHAKIDLWGVGTRLVTAYDQPALGGVYKLGAIRRGEHWRYTIKLSEQAVKINNPGLLKVRRYFWDGHAMADMIYDELLGIAEPVVIVDPADPTRRRRIPPGTRHEEMLVPIFRAGRRVYDPPTLAQVQRYAQAQLASLHPGIKRLLNPHAHPVGLERTLHELKTRLILETRGLA